MKEPSEVFNQLKSKIKPEWKIAFLSVIIMGILIHMPIMLQDIPNHDGLDSVYFDQNMITSGRWFLTIACGISSYYSLPWLIGLLSIFYLALVSVVLVEFLEIKSKLIILLCSGLLVAFPSVASTFAYVFTMDGYMMALFLAVLAPLCVKKCRFGFLIGTVALALSMGIYQAYLPFAALLCIYGIIQLSMESIPFRNKIKSSLQYLYMGILGVAGYYLMLQVLLKIQGKSLASYQGIDQMGSVASSSFFTILKNIYVDFFAFTLNGKVLFSNIFSSVSMLLFCLLAILTIVFLVWKKKWWKNAWFFIIIALLCIGLPIATNLILIISPSVNYHLLMRYQWVLYEIVLIAFIHKYGYVELKSKSCRAISQWILILTAGILMFNYIVIDQIAYANLNKRYEKTYAYCIRLLDRIEQTKGYYQGIPIAMIGVVGEEAYPLTDITQDITANMIGMSGDSLLYTGNNYGLFIQHYLGATLNILPPEAMEEMYYSKEYEAMDSFPGEDSIRIIDGILYVKTENSSR